VQWTLLARGVATSSAVKPYALHIWNVFALTQTPDLYKVLTNLSNDIELFICLIVNSSDLFHTSLMVVKQLLIKGSSLSP
jgi:hypothetical protein